ncbi:MAG: hypothetical protein RML93_12205 [Anaerolineales bacterium]|nr:hypothetical protein [Anaerolineales bacterium]MCS7248880.1 hypothetical protein [Anaerolineales bacterium]MDW8162693.1 hypothetical protein [Anaerolineales bacterium]MDW8448036.1 hypothetical protein [Anaerolineales bacterium]
MDEKLLEEINALLSENGRIRQTVRDRLILACIAEIYRATQVLPDIQRRIEQLERRSILLWAERHPKAALTLLAILLFLLNLGTFTDLRRLLFGLVGLPPDLTP